MILRASVEVYESARAALDAAYGYPNAETKTATAITPASDAVKDVAGRVYLVISESERHYEMASPLLNQLLADRKVEIVTDAEYAALVPSGP